MEPVVAFFFFSSRRRHTRCSRDWSSDVCSSDLLATLLGLTKERDPVKIERDLMALVPRDKWTWFSHTLIQHGRKVCIARRPKCELCVVNRWCPSSRV